MAKPLSGLINRSGSFYVFYRTESSGKRMKILYELSWLWETLGIALAAAAVCLTCAVLICRAKKRTLDKKIAAVIVAATFVLAVLAIIMLARTPALI